MPSRHAIALAPLVIAASFGTAHAAENPQTAYNNHCRQCHSMKEGDSRLGPSLHAIVGKKAGTTDFPGYSDSLKQSGITWDEATLDKWIANPNEVVSGNNMGTVFAGIEDEAQRKLIVEHLKSGSGAAAKN